MREALCAFEKGEKRMQIFVIIWFILFFWIIGKGIAQTKLPQMWVVGGNGTTSGAQNPIEMLVNTMTLEKLNSVAAPKATAK